MDAPLRLVLRQAGEAPFVRLEGCLDIAGAARLKQIVDRLVAEGLDHEAIELHLDDLGFCDSSGIHALVTIGQAASDAGRRVVLVRPRPSLMRLIDLLDVRSLLTIADF